MEIFNGLELITWIINSEKIKITRMSVNSVSKYGTRY